MVVGTDCILFHGFSAFIAGRIMMYGIFLSLAIAASALFWEMRKSWIAVVIPLLLVFLPLPSDKFLEIRPDTLAMLFVVIGLWIQMRCMNRMISSRTRIVSLLFAGACFATSLLVSQKMLTLVGVSLLGFVGWSRMRVGQRSITSRMSFIDIAAFFGGGVLIALCASIWFATLGNFSLIWYSLVTLPFEANKLSVLFPVAADFFFRPNDVIYGTGGYHIGYWLNLAIWVFGILIAVFRFVTAVTFQDSKTVWQETILSVNFILSILFFVHVMPMKHAQYLIPLAVFVVFYVADGLYLYWKENQKTIVHQAGAAVVFGVLLYLLFIGYRLVNEPKHYWGHENQRVQLETILKTIPTTEYLLDFECISLYYPTPYYITCMPVGQITPFLSLTIPTVRERIEETNTHYIYQGPWHRTQELLPEDRDYIAKRFTAIGNGSLLVRNDTVDSYRRRVSQ